MDGAHERPRRKIVVGGDYRKFRDWCRINDVSPMQAYYADSLEKLMGLELKKGDVVDLGGAPDQIYQMLLTRYR